MSAKLETMRVKPKGGLLVRNPIDRKPIPKEGIEVPRNAYWVRRLNFGEVELIEEVLKEEILQKESSSGEEKTLKKIKKKIKKKLFKGDE